MSHSSWTSTFRSKTLGSWNLHKLLSPPSHDLSFFLLLSSISSPLGTVGQANYAAANAYMDGLAHHRVSLGLNVAVLNLGVMVDDGMLVADPGKKALALQSGHGGQGVTRPEFWALLEYYCDPARGLLSQEDCQLIYGLALPADMRARGKQPGHRMALPFFSHMFTVPSEIVSDASDGIARSGDTDGRNAARKSFHQELASAHTLADAGALICRGIVNRLAHSLLPAFSRGGSTRKGEDADGDVDIDIDVSKPLRSFGVDSLLAIELRSWLASEVGVDMPVFEILGEMSLRELGEAAAARSGMVRSVTERENESEKEEGRD